MKKNIRYILAIVPAAFILAIALVGCETTNREQGITITATEVAIGERQSITLTAAPSDDTGTQEIFLPLEWWVENPTLGRIIRSGGYTAVYVSTTLPGGQVIGVRDQRGASGVIGVTQSASAVTDGTVE